MAMYYNGKKVRNLYYNGKCITRLALGKEMSRLVEGDDFVRAEWLVGDGSAYIDTNIPLKNISNYSIKIYITKLHYSEGIFGARISAEDDVNLEIIIYSGNNLACDFGNYEQNRKFYTVQPDTQYTIEWSDGVLSVNNDSIATVRYSTSSEFTAKLFASLNYTSATNMNKFQDKIASLVISDVIDLIPCRLLRPIPATLDANGIARNADECGMYNSVNGLFYGNVGSGSFTVSDN